MYKLIVLLVSLPLTVLGQDIPRPPVDIPNSGYYYTKSSVEGMVTGVDEKNKNKTNEAQIKGTPEYNWFVNQGYTITLTQNYRVVDRRLPEKEWLEIEAKGIERTGLSIEKANSLVKKDKDEKKKIHYYEMDDVLWVHKNGQWSNDRGDTVKLEDSLIQGHRFFTFSKKERTLHQGSDPKKKAKYFQEGTSYSDGRFATTIETRLEWGNNEKECNDLQESEKLVSDLKEVLEGQKQEDLPIKKVSIPGPGLSVQPVPSPNPTILVLPPNGISKTEPKPTTKTVTQTEPKPTTKTVTQTEPKPTTKTVTQTGPKPIPETAKKIEPDKDLIPKDDLFVVDPKTAMKLMDIDDPNNSLPVEIGWQSGYANGVPKPNDEKNEELKKIKILWEKFNFPIVKNVYSSRIFEEREIIAKLGAAPLFSYTYKHVMELKKDPELLKSFKEAMKKDDVKFVLHVYFQRDFREIDQFGAFATRTVTPGKRIFLDVYNKEGKLIKRAVVNEYNQEPYGLDKPFLKKSDILHTIKNWKTAPHPLTDEKLKELYPR